MRTKYYVKMNRLKSQKMAFQSINKKSQVSTMEDLRLESNFQLEQNFNFKKVETIQNNNSKTYFH